MNKFMQLVVLFFTVVIVAASMLLANMGARGGVAAATPDNPLYTPYHGTLTAVLIADSFDDPVYVLRYGIISYRVGRVGGNPVGAVFVVSTTGWQPGLIYLVGVGSDGRISGVHIIDHNETPDFWEIVLDARFYSGLVGNAAGFGFDEATGATRTSYALFRGAYNAIELFARYVQPQM